MPWNQQGGGQGPWGKGPTGRGGGPQPPDIEEILRRSQDKLKQFAPGGFGAGRGLVLIIVAVTALWLASGFYEVGPKELGVEMVFGRMESTQPPGLNYNWPSPIGMVLKPQVTTINQINVGFREASASGRGQTGAGRNVSEESLMLTGDENIIDIQFTVFWKIDTRLPASGEIKDNLEGVRNYLFNIRNPEMTVKNAAESSMREVIGKGAFEHFRTKGRRQIALETKNLLQEILDRYGAGIEVTDMQIVNVNPPAAVINAFRDVQVARADMERKVNEADAYRNEVLEKAHGEASQIVLRAEGYKQKKIEIANGEAKRFISVYDQYAKDKDITKRRLYLDSMKDVLKDMDKILIDNSKGGSGVIPYLPLNELTRGRASGTTGAPASSGSTFLPGAASSGSATEGQGK